MTRVRVVLDTQALLWWATADTRLGGEAARVIGVGTPVISVASLWEIAIKTSIGKLSAHVHDITALMNVQAMQRLAIDDAHIAAVQTLPMHHRDPFDRMLVAQAMTEDLPILSSDSKFGVYSVTVIDALR